MKAIARQINLEKLENSHFPITKFTLVQTKIGKFYPNIKTFILISVFYAQPKIINFGV